MYNLPEPKFKDLQRSTDELIAACQRGMEAARELTNHCKPIKVKKQKKEN